MADRELIRDKLGFLKLLFALIWVSNATDVGWLAQHYKTAPLILSIAAGVAAVALGVILGAVFFRIVKYFRQMQE